MRWTEAEPYSLKCLVTGFSEDEMRRPTLYAVPCSGLQLSTSSKGSEWKEDRPMNDGSRAPTPMVTAGLDLGDHYTYLCLLNIRSAEVLEEGRLRTTPEAFKRRFDSEQQLRA